MFQRLFDSILDLVFPPCCAGCGRVDTAWCPSCDRKLRAVPLNLQPRTLPYLQACLSTGVHDGELQKAIHLLKYEGVTDVAPALGDRLLVALNECGWSFDTIVPVPLFTARLKERGYNQSQVVGSYMAQHMAQSVVSTALERYRPTRSQVGLSHDERLQNVHDAFRANPSLVSATTILLLDDVMTTGATLQECAHALLDAGARAVMSLTITAALP
ncbi:MAG: ComF family protein [Chloroflexi bacterium]|nr:ComF family protein [Chloroflexota bacterium]